MAKPLTINDLVLIHTPFGVYYWHWTTGTWQPTVIKNGKIIPVAVLAPRGVPHAPTSKA